MLGIILTALYSLAVACHRCYSTDVLLIMHKPSTEVSDIFGFQTMYL